jgi:penicillin-binding protein 1A
MIFRSRYSIGKVSNTRFKRSIGARYQQKSRRQKKAEVVFKFVLKMGLYGAIIIGVLLGAGILFVSRDLPQVSQIETYIPNETTKIYSEDGVVLAELHHEEDRDTIKIEKISPILIKAVIAVEDRHFYSHKGLDFMGISRALYRDILAGAFVEGGSTLTQQLARNLFLSRKRKLSRKFSEAILAVRIEKNYTKQEILEMYLNQVYWGHNSYGIQSAATLYFAKSASQLTLAESAMLVGLLTGPELYSPFRNFAGAKKRQKLVLNQMVKQKLITHSLAMQAYEDELILKKQQKLRHKAPYFTQYIIKQLINMYGEEATYTSGMKVYTSLNYALQEKAEEIVKKYIEYGQTPKWVRKEKVPSLNYGQAAMLSLDPRSGGIKVMVGGYGFLENQFNRTIQAKRQPGSAFKPFVYLAALQKGFSPGSIIEDSPVTFNTVEGPYSPNNYTQKYLGKLPMRKALEKSVNVIAIKLNYLIGPKNVVKVAQDIGIKSPLKPILSLPLGANEVTMLELVSAYGVFATQGRRVEPVSILKIEDREGSPLYQHQRKEQRVFDTNLIATLVEMMQGVVKYGTGRNANLPRPVAGKTGTTSEYRDAWFVGFVPQLVTASWVGNDDNSPTSKITGGWVPAMMWKEFMVAALKNISPQNFPKPRKLVSRKINWLTGKLATEFSPVDYISIEKFWAGKEPKEFDDQASVTPQRGLQKNNQFLNFFN